MIENSKQLSEQKCHRPFPLQLKRKFEDTRKGDYDVYSPKSKL